MPSAKLAAALGLAALSLSACGTTAKPEAGTAKAIAKSVKGLDDARQSHITCLRQAGIAVRLMPVVVAGQSLPGFQVLAPGSPTAAFEATPGGSQIAQIHGQAQGAEVIGAALLFPNGGSDALLSKVETCMAQGVTG